MACFPGAVLSVLWSTGSSPPLPHAILCPPFPPTSCLVRALCRRTSDPLPPSADSFLPHLSISALPSRGGSGEEAGAAPCIIFVVVFVVVTITIIVIISQMRGAKLELCPSPSSWLTVTNSSFIHYAHHLSTGQRRQEPAESPPPNRGLEGTALCNGVSSMSPFRHSVRAERKQLVSHAWMSSSSSTVEGGTVLPT